MREHPEAPEAPHEAPEQPRAPWWSGKIPVMMALALFMSAALLLPVETAEDIGAIFGERPAPVQGVFTEETARLDEALDAGEPVEVARVRALRHELMLRRVLRAGPMSEGHLRQAREILVELDAQLAMEAHPGGRAALRRATARRLARRFPRLDAAALERELEVFAAQYERAVGAPHAPSPADKK